MAWIRTAADSESANSSLRRIITMLATWKKTRDALYSRLDHHGWPGRRSGGLRDDEQRN